MKGLSRRADPPKRRTKIAAFFWRDGRIVYQRMLPKLVNEVRVPRILLGEPPALVSGSTPFVMEMDVYRLHASGRRSQVTDSTRADYYFLETPAPARGSTH